MPTVYPFEIGEVESADKDARRELLEFNGHDSSVQKFVVGKDPKPLGNHYHTKKKETFFVIQGKGTVALCPINDPTGKEIFEIGPNSVILVGIGVAHTFWMDQGSIFISVSSSRFNPNDKDLNPFPLTLD